MKEARFPFTNMNAEVEVKKSDDGRVWKYRVESFKIASGLENEIVVSTEKLIHTKSNKY